MSKNSEILKAFADKQGWSADRLHTLSKTLLLEEQAALFREKTARLQEASEDRGRKDCEPDAEANG